MLIVNRFINRATGKTTIQAHVIKGKQVIRSYSACDESLLDMITQHYSVYLLTDVSHASKLDVVNLISVK